MKTGLVLEGGAMRGLFTAGVMDVFMEAELRFDGIVGVSAGAVFGCNYKSRQIGRVLRYNTTYCRDPRYCSLRSLIRTGDLYGADFCYREIPQKLDIFDWETFRDTPEEFVVVATDLESGKAIYHRCTDCGEGDLTWMRASASMPLVSRVVEIDGYKLLDGGIADSIPLRYFEREGYARNVVVLTQPPEYRKESNRLLPLMRLLFQQYPNFIRTAECRHTEYNETREYIRKREREGAVLVLSPDAPLPISRVEKDPAALREVYEIGRHTAQERLAHVREFLR